MFVSKSFDCVSAGSTCVFLNFTSTVYRHCSERIVSEQNVQKLLTHINIAG